MTALLKDHGYPGVYEYIKKVYNLTKSDTDSLRISENKLREALTS